jgi:glycosyltransferase involved in cell wall biosynthesis
MAEHRVVIISDLGGGGAQRVALALMADWVVLGHKVTLITLANEEDDQYYLPSGVIRIALNATGPSGGVISSLRANIRRVRLLRKAIKSSHADRIISFVAATNILTILATRGLGKYVVISERNDPDRQNLGRFWEKMRRLTYRKATIVTANSHQALNALEEYVPRGKLVFVPNPLPGWFQERPRDQQPGPPREKIVLAVGRLHPQKAYDRLLSIFEQSGARSLGWKLVILGEGAERGALAQLADRLGLAQSLQMPGHTKDVQKWYQRAGLFVMASHYEGMPNTMIEAICAGMPVLVSKSCGDAAHYANTLTCGVLMDTSDISGSAAQLTDVLEDEPRRKNLGQNGREKISEFFGPQIVRAAWEQALTKE